MWMPMPKPTRPPSLRVISATGIVIFAGALHAVAPIQEEARRSTEALDGLLDPPQGERATLWLQLFVSTANVALGSGAHGSSDRPGASRG
jgi:hypothetical protein